jgi:alanine racemase
VRAAQLSSFIARLKDAPAIDVTGLCTHLAHADGDDPSVSEAQLHRFDEARASLASENFHPQLTHAANSAGAYRFVQAHFNLVRPGLSLYGYGGFSPAGVQPVMTLKSKVVALRDLLAGEKVSYNGLWQASGPTRIATVPIGYADGYTRRLPGKTDVLMHGHRCPVVGAITMDMCMVDVTGINCSIGDEVVLLGSQGNEKITAKELAQRSDTIEWEIISAIGKRVPRVYVGERG